VAAVVVLTTAGSEEEARKIADALIERRLAACVNVVGGVTSVYRWEGTIQRDPEVLMIIKSTEARLEALKNRVAELHSYQVPEIIAVPVSEGWPAYLDWVRKETGADD